MGANVADYSVVEDKQFTVDNDNGPDSKTLDFTFRGGFLKDGPGIFSFVIVRSNNLHLRVEINSTGIYDDDFANTNSEKVMQEVFSMKDLSLDASGNQKVRFTAVRGSGRFSDVIVWYRRDSE